MRSSNEQAHLDIADKANINIFDVFAYLYGYCEPRFNEIDEKLAEKSQYLKMDGSSQDVARCLPPPEAMTDVLGDATRQQLKLRLESARILDELDVESYAILRAVDAACHNARARSANLSNFPTVSQQLTRNGEFGQVFPKREPVLFHPSDRNNPSHIRAGKDMGKYLRDYLDNLVCLRVPEGYDLDFGSIDSTARLCFSADKSSFRIALFPLLDKMTEIVVQTFDTDGDGKKPFRFVGLLDAAGLAQKALLALERANESGATAVLFPELCVPLEVRHVIAEALRNRRFPNVNMVFAGSFHELVDDRWYNAAYVLGPHGEELWCQHKLQPYTLMKYEAAKVPSLASFADCDSYEKISTAPRVVAVRDTPMGRVAVLICSDLLKDDPHRRILFDIGVSLVLVPAMSGRLGKEFELAAREFSIYCGATTCVSNDCAIAREARGGDAKGAEVALAFVPRYPQTRVWRCPNSSGECNARTCHQDRLVDENSWPSKFSPTS